jgi:hypothetical protein
MPPGELLGWKIVGKSFLMNLNSLTEIWRATLKKMMNFTCVEWLHKSFGLKYLFLSTFSHVDSCFNEIVHRKVSMIAQKIQRNVWEMSQFSFCFAQLSSRRSWKLSVLVLFRSRLSFFLCCHSKSGITVGWLYNFFVRRCFIRVLGTLYYKLVSIARN